MLDGGSGSDGLDSGGDEYIAENSDVIIGYTRPATCSTAAAASDTLDSGGASDDGRADGEEYIADGGDDAIIGYAAASDTLDGGGGSDKLDSGGATDRSWQR